MALCAHIYTETEPTTDFFMETPSDTDLEKSDSITTLDDWNSAVFRSRPNCSSDGAEGTDSGRACHARAAANRKV